jgi:hypothetical protein
MTSTAADIEAEIRAQLPDEIPLAGIAEQVHAKALEVAEYARSIAPVYKGRDPRAKPGEYRDSITVEEIPEHRGLPAERVITRDWKAHWIEFGTAKWPEHAVFAQTAAHFGGTFDRVTGEVGTQGRGTIEVGFTP